MGKETPGSLVDISTVMDTGGRGFECRLGSEIFREEPNDGFIGVHSLKNVRVWNNFLKDRPWLTLLNVLWCLNPLSQNVEHQREVE